MARARSQLYQVDFMAALFGGFVLVWLSGANDAEMIAAPNVAPVFFSIRGRLLYDSEPSSIASQTVLPVEAVAVSCMPTDWFSDVYPTGRFPSACHGDAQYLSHTKAYFVDVETQAKEDAPTLQQSVVDSHGIQLSIVPSGEGLLSDVAWVGRVLESAGLPPAQRVHSAKEHVTFLSDPQTTAVGVVPRTWKTVPYIQVQHPARIATVEFDQIDASSGDRSFRFNGIEKEIPYDNTKEHEKALSLEIVLHWDLKGANQCYTGELKTDLHDDLSERVPLHRC